MLFVGRNFDLELRLGTVSASLGTKRNLSSRGTGYLCNDQRATARNSTRRRRGYAEKALTSFMHSVPSP